LEKVHHWIGVDMGSESFAAAVLTELGKPIPVRDPIPNTPEGYAVFAGWINGQGITVSNAVICLEATGVYGEGFCYHFHAQGFRVAVEPPNKVKKAFETNGDKTDAVDSRQIAEYACRFYDELHYWEPKAEILEQVRTLLSAREQFTVQLTSCKNGFKALERKVVRTPMALDMYAETIQRLQENIKKIDREIERLIKRDPLHGQVLSHLKSIPGVGLLLSSSIYVLSNGFSLELDAGQVASYAKVCPRRHESGTSVYRKPRCQKFGPSKIRKLLYLSALTAIQYNKTLKAYFLRKVAEGKAKRLVVNNVANKILRIICGILKNGEPFIENYRSINPVFLKIS
jgi:transposase